MHGITSADIANAIEKSDGSLKKIADILNVDMCYISHRIHSDKKLAKMLGIQKQKHVEKIEGNIFDVANSGKEWAISFVLKNLGNPNWREKKK